MPSHPTQTPDFDPTCAQAMLNVVRAALPRDPEADEEALKAQHWLATRMLGDLRPTRPTEAILAAHAVAAHFAAMDAWRRARDPAVTNTLAHRMRGGARASARLSEEAMRCLQRVHSLISSRVRGANVLQRAVVAARQVAEPPVAPPMQRDQEPMHQPKVQAEPPAPTTVDTALQASTPLTQPPAATEAAQNSMHQSPACQPPVHPAPNPAPTPAWMLGLPDMMFADHLRNLPTEDLLALTEAMINLQQSFPDGPAPDKPDVGSAA